jgi:hypothetical protein
MAFLDQDVAAIATARVLGSAHAVMSYGRLLVA